MSCNLCKKNCDYCGIDAVSLTGPEYYAEKRSTCQYFADAECRACGAKYTAWREGHHGERAGKCTADPEYLNRYDECWGCDGCANEFYDLSYRSTFNDEPGESDIPAGDVKVILTIKNENGKSCLIFERTEIK